MNRITWSVALSVALLAACGKKDPPPPAAPPPPPKVEAPQPPELLSRDLLFGNPDRARGRISPDGKHLAFLAPRNGVLNIHVAPIGDLTAAKPISDDKLRGINQYWWSADNQYVLYIQDQKGDENYHLYRVDLAGEKTVDLTPLPGIRAEVLAVSFRHPESVVVGLNDRGDHSLHDVHRLNLADGKRTLLAKNDEGFAFWSVDDDYRVRLAGKQQPDGSVEVLRQDGKKWKTLLTIPQIDSLTTNIMGFDKSGEVVYLLDSRGRNTAALSTLHLGSGELKVLHEDPRADVQGVLLHPSEHTVLAASSEYEKVQWQPLDDSVKPDLEYLAKFTDGKLTFLNATKDNALWIVGYDRPDAPFSYYLYDHGKREAKFLMTLGSQWENKPFTTMHSRVVKSRDGLDLVTYLSLPRESDPDRDGKPAAPLPTVLAVHGGPWGRDSYGLNMEHQWLANRGYAVISVNFRGSTGLGKSFTNAGDKQWAGKMHDDLIDTVNWAVKEGVADAKKIAITGGSYGGYATLVGLTFTPDVFACGVDIVGPSNLITLLNSIPPYWKPLLDMFTSRVGDPRTEEGRKLLESRSPLTFVEKINKPLLIGQGANDPRVKQAEADQIANAMQAKGIPVTYVLFADEGHGFARPENSKAFSAIQEAFLGACLGGRVEPIGDDFTAANFTVPNGAEFVPGLKEALPKPPEPAPADPAKES